MSKVGINGFGRIGRLVLRRSLLMISLPQKFSPTC